MKFLQCLWLFSLLLWMASCQKEAVELRIDDEIAPYLTTFLEEAALRGLDMEPEMTNLEAYFTDIEGAGVVGQCQTFSDGSADLLIEKNYWRSINSMKKEFLIFHELGHCVLGRSHLDTSDENGFCTSIMQSGTDDCNNNYNASTRAAYLDELFDF